MGNNVCHEKIGENMATERAKRFRRNVFFGMFNQVLIFAIGLIVPRLILDSYGDEVNGLLSTVVQIFTYIGLLEAGIGNASLNALYKPFANADQYEVCDVFSATQKYFRKVTYIYLGCVGAVSVIYPLLISSTIPFLTIFFVILFQGLSGALTFFFVAAYRQVLMADGKNYVVSNIALIIYILTSAVKIVLMGLGFDVVLVQAGYFVVHVAQILIFVIYMRKKYPWLKKHKNPNMKALSQRSAFFVHELSGVVFSSTDTFVLSTFCGLILASIYSVYNMIFVALNSLINSLNSGLQYVLGQTYNKDKEKYVKVHDVYDDVYMSFVFALFTVAYVLICPFITIYTANATDVTYVDYWLPILFVSIQLLSCGRATSARLITISGHAKATQWRSLLEAGINLAVSIVAVNFIGIYGVLIGTIVALLYRFNDIVIYANKKILHRNPIKTYAKFFFNVIIFVAVVVLEMLFRTTIARLCSSIWGFLIMAVVLTIVSMCVYFGKLLIVSRGARQVIVSRLKSKKSA